jgi:hypothetical protein
MKYSVLTSSNTGNLKFIKNYVKTINKQIILPDEIIFINNRSYFNYVYQFLITNLNKKIKLKYINYYYNKNVSYSLNHGLKYTNNLLILRLDIDDTWIKFHSKIMIDIFKKNKNILILSNNIINLKTKSIVDANLLTGNPTIHSSWLINLNNCRSFKYKNIYPEDYGTLSHYFRSGYKFKLIKEITVNHYSNVKGLGASSRGNIDTKSIKKKNFNHYFKNKNYFNLIKEYNFFQLLKILLK